MSHKQFFQGIYVILTVLCILLIAILFTLMTKDEWPEFGLLEFVFTALFFLMFPAYGEMCKRYGMYLMQNRPRKRIEYVTYEPHGIKFTQHRK